MPFDAFLTHQLVYRWNRQWEGLEVPGVLADKSRIVLQGWNPQTRQKVSILIVLASGLARMHETHHRLDIPKTSQPVFTRFLPFTIEEIFTPHLDRVIWIKAAWQDDWGQTVHGYFVIELTGHLTNFLVLNAEHVILEAFRHFPTNKQGRTIMPGQLYQCPRPLPDPCVSHSLGDLPPSARPLAAGQGDAWSWDTLCSDLEHHRLKFFRLERGAEQDVWVYPRPGWTPVAVDDPDAALDDIFWEKDRESARISLHHQLTSFWQDRVSHLCSKLQEATIAMQEDPDLLKENGDLWLAYQYQLATQTEITVQRFSNPEMFVTLTLEEDKTAGQMAEMAYRTYKKTKSRVEASARLVEALKRQIATAEASLADAAAAHDERYLRSAIKAIAPQSRHAVQRPQHFRQFSSASGFTILVGRSREENQELTIKRARPDDLWFHVKQSPGSHVVLFSGKVNPNLDDLLDAAHLAVYYSSAKHSSTVAVDYTKRKFVRKRPHAEAGQVLYEREKTLYITPDADRLRKLGATGDKLAE